MQYMYEWENVVKKVEHPSDNRMSLLRWEKPGPGFFNLIVDGTRSTNGLIGAGGVIRDWSDNWVHGFMLNIGVGEVLQAETWGLFYGLQLAKDLGVTHMCSWLALLHSFGPSSLGHSSPELSKLYLLLQFLFCLSHSS